MSSSSCAVMPSLSHHVCKACVYLSHSAYATQPFPCFMKSSLACQCHDVPVKATPTGVTTRTTR